jgi:hypothetical protein
LDVHLVLNDKGGIGRSIVAEDKRILKWRIVQEEDA